MRSSRSLRHRGPKGKSLAPALAAFLLLFVGMTCSANAQEQTDSDGAYETLPFADEFKMPDESAVDKSDREAIRQFRNQQSAVRSRRKEMQSQVTSALEGRGGAGNSVESFLRGFAIPEMTQTDEETLADLGNIRERYFRNYLERVNNASNRDTVIRTTDDMMRQVAEGNFHPACRINAVVVLGKLDSREGSRSNGQLPVPFAPAFSYLLQLVSDASQPEYLRIAAISGIERHASVRAQGSGNEFDAGSQRELVDAMLPFVESSAEGLSDEAAYWLKRRAVRTLGYLGTTGDNGRVASAIKAIMKDKDEKLVVRADAVEAYSRLQFTDATAADLANVIDTIAEIVIFAADKDAAYLEQQSNKVEFIARFMDGKKKATDNSEKRDQASVGLGGSGSGDRGRGGGDDGAGGGAKTAPEIVPEYHREVVRRRFKHYLWSCRKALIGGERGVRGGLAPLASGDDEALIDALVREFDQLMDATDIRTPDPDADEASAGGSGNDEEQKKKPLTLAEQLAKALEDGAADIKDAVDRYHPPVEAEDSSDPPVDGAANPPADGEEGN